MAELKNITRKRIFLGGRVSESGNMAYGSEVTETPELTETVDIVAFCDCGHKESAKVFRDRFTGLVVCENCLVTCAKCQTKVWVGVAKKAWGSEERFCPDCSSGRLLKSLKNILLGGLTDK